MLDHKRTRHLRPADADWRCHRCDRLLGRRRDGRLHVEFKRGAEYLASLPVTATCRGCGALNELG